MNYKRYCKLVCFIHLLIAWSNAITSNQLLVNMIQQYSEIEIGNRELVKKAWCLIIFQFIFGCYYYAPFNFCSFKILFAYFGNCYWIHIRMFISQFFFKKKLPNVPPSTHLSVALLVIMPTQSKKRPHSSRQDPLLNK